MPPTSAQHPRFACCPYCTPLAPHTPFMTDVPAQTQAARWIPRTASVRVQLLFERRFNSAKSDESQPASCRGGFSSARLESPHTRRARESHLPVGGCRAAAAGGGHRLWEPRSARLERLHTRCACAGWAGRLARQAAGASVASLPVHHQLGRRRLPPQHALPAGAAAVRSMSSRSGVPACRCAALAA
jgi:hypothetical protein